MKSLKQVWAAAQLFPNQKARASEEPKATIEVPKQPLKTGFANQIASFSCASRMKGIRWAAAQTCSGDWSLPPPVADMGRRNVGNRKERLRDYAGFSEVPEPHLRFALSFKLLQRSRCDW